MKHQKHRTKLPRRGREIAIIASTSLYRRRLIARAIMMMPAIAPREVRSRARNTALRQDMGEKSEFQFGIKLPQQIWRYLPTQLPGKFHS